jgi:8-oxo-dGTP diphosphatase
MIWKDIAAIIFYTRDNKILLQDRRGISKLGEDWGFFGGKIEDGETPERAVVREIKEELDYDLGRSAEFFMTIQLTVDRQSIKINWFTCPLDDKMRHFTVLEGPGMRLFSIEGTKNLKLMPGQHEAIQEFEKVFVSRVNSHLR